MHGIGDKHKQRVQEQADRTVSGRIVICFSEPAEIIAHQEQELVCTRPFHKCQQWPNGCMTNKISGWRQVKGLF